MPTKYNDEYDNYKGGNTDQYYKRNHRKDQRRRNNAYIKKSQQFEEHIFDGNSIYHDISNKKVNKVSKDNNDYYDNIYKYPNRCGCCWKPGTRWYRRHHRDLVRKGKNKDKSHYKSMINRPSHMSSFCHRQIIKEGLSIHLS